MTEQQLEHVLQRVYGQSVLPKPFNLLTARGVTREGTAVGEAARSIGTTSAKLRQFIDAPDAIQHLFGERAADYAVQEQRVRATIGQLIIGNLAERVFEETYRQTVGTTELRLQDDRSGGGDTDYLVLNGQDRRVFRLNIKFHGSQFRNAEPLVGLAPEDCFALATYKIFSALQKQDREHLPYIFVVVGVPNLTGSVVGTSIPKDVAEFATLARVAPRVTGKRKIEDAVVHAMTTDPQAFGLSATLEEYTRRIRDAGWRVISARRASDLLKALLFERVYALRLRAFAKNYRGAEVDMHFSISRDLQPLGELLQVLRDHGLPGLSVRLERGTL